MTDPNFPNAHTLSSLLSHRAAVGLVLAVVLGGSAAVACSGGDDPGADPGTGGNTDAGDGSSGGPDGSVTGPNKLSRASRGSGMDISEDDTLLVSVNRDVDSVSVFDVAYPQGAPPVLTKKAEIKTCADPSQIVLSPNGDRAFVVCRKDQKLMRLDALRTAPVAGPTVAVGSEPTGVALTPKATSAWVANWMDGTVTEVSTENMTVTATVDLNAALVETGSLGEITARPALAHPRSVAITNNKDDLENDESIFVTEFFGQQKETLAANGANADIAKQGFVYRISVRDKTVKTVALPPIADIGIHDHADGIAGCYPNQVQAVDIQGSFAYVLSICASPKGPLGDFTGPAKAACTVDSTCPGAAAGACDTVAGTCKTNCTMDSECGLGGVCAANTCKLNMQDVKTFQTPAVSVIDIGANKVIASVPLNSEFDKLFNARSVPDTSARRYPLHATDIAFVPGTLIGYMPAKGANAVYRVDFNATYETKAVDSVGSADRPFIQLDQGTLDAAKVGKMPTAIAMGHKAKLDAQGRFAFVLNEGTRNITTIDLAVDDIAGLSGEAAIVSSTAMPTDPLEESRLEGERLFETGLGRWSWNGQAWGACSTCHWDGLSDQVTWFHLRGVRQSPSLDQTINKKNTKQLRMMNWQANSDELTDHEAGALRTVLGGVGAVTKNFDLTLDARIAFDKYGHAGLGGSSEAAADPTSSSTLVGEVNVLSDWKHIDNYEATIHTPKKPSNLDAAQVAAGKAAFEEAKCQGCHGGDLWTIATVFYAPDANVASPTNVNKALRTLSWTTAVTNAGFPTKLLPTVDGPSQTMRYNGTNAAALDSITCLLRPVGTYGVGEPGVGVAELRRNMAAAGQGNEATGKGFNVPSLLGMGVNAPYFHAGNARTLEALLSDPFSAHHAALTDGFLGAGDAQAAQKRAALVQFLLSIDEQTETIAVPALGPNGGTFCDVP